MNDVMVKFGNDVAPDGHLSFMVAGKEMIRLEPNGNIWVRGVLTTNDLQVVDGMRAFLIGCGVLKS